VCVCVFVCDAFEGAGCEAGVHLRVPPPDLVALCKLAQALCKLASIYLSIIYLLPIHLSISLSLYLSIYINALIGGIYLSIYRSIYLSINACICMYRDYLCMHMYAYIGYTYYIGGTLTI